VLSPSRTHEFQRKAPRLHDHPQNNDRKPTADDLAETRVRMGDALEALGRTIGLTNEDFEIFDRVKYNTPEDSNPSRNP